MNLTYKEYIIYPLNSRNSKIFSDIGFVNIDNRPQGVTRDTHRTCFIVKDNKSLYFDSLGGQPDNFLINQLPKAIIYQSIKFKFNILNYVHHYLCFFYFLLKE